MAKKLRSDVIDEGAPGLYHIYSRTVRRAWLMGRDPITGKNYDHRRKILEEELKYLMARFAIECAAFSILSNHFHLLLRNRPDIVKEMSDEEVAQRWHEIAPGDSGRRRDGKPPKFTRRKLEAMLADKKLIKKIRRRLSSISWLMQLMKQRVARMFNVEEEVSGRFWAGTFHAESIDSPEQLLATMTYIDANQFRAGMVKTLGASEHSSVRTRIRAAKRLKRLRRVLRKRGPKAYAQARDRMAKQDRVMALVDEWLAPIDESTPPGQTPAERVGKVAAGLTDTADSPFTSSPAERGLRLTDKGVLSMTGEEYLKLLEWTIKEEQRRAEAARQAESDRITGKDKKRKAPREKLSDGQPYLSRAVRKHLRRLGIAGPNAWMKAFGRVAVKTKFLYRKPVNTPAEDARCEIPTKTDAQNAPLRV